MIRSSAIVLIWLVVPASAIAQENELNNIVQSLNLPVSSRMIYLMILLTVLSLAPGLLIMVTSFTRIVVAFSLLRSSIGLQSTPANLVLISLALFMTFFVMAPTFDKAWNSGIQPLLDKKISEQQAIQNTVKPFRKFMLAQVREKDLRMFSELATKSLVTEKDKVDLRILVPAFMISELRRAFEIGFLIAVPFLIIDIVVATIIMSMGMMMMPPSVISLPIKILFFVLIDGWNLLVGSLVRSFA